MCSGGGLGNPGESGTVGVFTGTIGGRIGIGPTLDGVRFTFVLDEGVLRMVAVPEAMTLLPPLLPLVVGAPWADSAPCSPAVLAGRLVWIIRR